MRAHLSLQRLIYPHQLASPLKNILQFSHDQIVPTELYLICVGSKTITAKQSTLGRAKTSVSRAKVTVSKLSVSSTFHQGKLNKKLLEKLCLLWKQLIKPQVTVDFTGSFWKGTLSMSSSLWSMKQRKILKYSCAF